MSKPKEFVGSKEAAEILERTAASVKRYASDGELPFVHKMPGRTGGYVFRRADVVKFKRFLEAEAKRRAARPRPAA